MVAEGVTDGDGVEVGVFEGEPVVVRDAVGAADCVGVMEAAAVLDGVDAGVPEFEGDRSATGASAIPAH